MKLFTGTHVNRIDAKGRVSVPRAFRAVLENRGFEGFYAYPSHKLPALEAVDEERMGQIADRIDEFDMFSDEQDDLAALILESSEYFTWDREGRIILSGEWQEAAGLAGEVAFVGRGRSFQMLAPSNVDSRKKQATERLRARRTTFNLHKGRKDEEAEE